MFIWLAIPMLLALFLIFRLDIRLRELEKCLPDGANAEQRKTEEEFYEALQNIYNYGGDFKRLRTEELSDE